MSLILNGTSGISDVDGSAATPAVRGTDTNTGIFFPAADTIAFTEGGVESMRITSTGDVGIGTTSPAVKLQVNGAVFANLRGNNAILLDSAGSYYGAIQNNSSDVWSLGYSGTAGTLGTSVLTWNGTGRVGVGTTSPQRKVSVIGVDGASGQTEGNSRTSLFLDNNGANYLSIFTSTSGDGGIFFSDNGSNNGGMVYETTNDALYFKANNAERMRITSAGLLQFNSGYGSVATAYGCRAWVNFNGTGTVAIRASGNVSSITDNATGDYTVNFSTSMPDANYVCHMDSELESANATHVRMHGVYYNTRLTGSVRVRVGGTATEFGPDSQAVMVTIFR